MQELVSRELAIPLLNRIKVRACLAAMSVAYPAVGRGTHTACSLTCPEC